MFSALTSPMPCRVVLRVSTVTQKIVVNRSIHIACRVGNNLTKSRWLCDSYKRSKLVQASFVRYASTTDTNAVQNDPLEHIPEPPPLPQEVLDTIVNTVTNAEGTLASLGLGGYTPKGFVQNSLEYLHLTCNMPWWTTIVLGTLCVRLLIFPLVIMSQKNAVKMQNNMPQMQEIQAKMTEARQSGDQHESAVQARELWKFMSKKGISPAKNFLVTTVQAPVFITFFLALREMANTPVESLREGGLWWFTDLTVYDPFYILPVVTCVTLFVTIEIGTDTAAVHSLGWLKPVFRAIPVVAFPFMMHFPSAILCYWLSTNVISLVQVGCLKIPTVKKFLNMPVPIVHDKKKLQQKPQTFFEGVQSSWTNMKIAKKVGDRLQADLRQFQNAGRGPIPKTYKYDPRKENVSHAMSMKEKSQ